MINFTNFVPAHQLKEKRHNKLTCKIDLKPMGVTSNGYKKIPKNWGKLECLELIIFFKLRTCL